MCLESALRMASIDSTLGVISTFFFLLRTEHYNLFSKDGTQIVERILEIGHCLGLHFDCSAYPPESTVDELASACAKEARILEELFGRAISIVSYHKPDQRVLTGDPRLSYPRQHTYMPLFMESAKYFSDSRGSWANGVPTNSDFFRKTVPLHLLVHPIWWNEYPSTPLNTLLEFRKRTLDRLDRSLTENCSVYRLNTCIGPSKE